MHAYIRHYKLLCLLCNVRNAFMMYYEQLSRRYNVLGMTFNNTNTFIMYNK